MTWNLETDLKAVMADLAAIGAAGVPIVIGATTLLGVVEYVGRDVLATMNVGGISGRVITVTVQTSQLPAGLKNRTALTVDGQPMRLRDSQLEGDGSITRLLCEYAS